MTASILFQKSRFPGHDRTNDKSYTPENRRKGAAQQVTDNSLISERIGSLSPTSFENLVYDCVRAIGLTDLIWRTPGADGGRDIEGELVTTDVTGYYLRQKWYVECKRYSSSISWPTIWQKISYAEVHKADVLFLVTNSNPSPRCETEINKWNASKRLPIIRIWRGYDLPRLLRRHITISRAHGLADPVSGVADDALDLASVINKLVQSAYSSVTFDQDGMSALEAASCLSELLSQRLSDLRNYGKFVNAPVARISPNFDWLELAGESSAWEDVGLRAILTFVHHVSSCDTMSVMAHRAEVSLTLIGPNTDFFNLGSKDFNTVLLWARSEMVQQDAVTNTLLIRQRGF